MSLSVWHKRKEGNVGARAWPRGGRQLGGAGTGELRGAPRAWRTRGISGISVRALASLRGWKEPGSPGHLTSVRPGTAPQGGRAHSKRFLSGACPRAQVQVSAHSRPSGEPCEWSERGDTVQPRAYRERRSYPPHVWLGQERLPRAPQDGGPAPPSQVAGGDKGVGAPDSAEVDHGAVIGHLYRLADAGLAAF